MGSRPALDGYWVDVGTPERYLGRPGTSSRGAWRPGRPTAPGRFVGAGPESPEGDRRVAGGRLHRLPVGADAEVTGSVLLAGGEVGDEALVSGSILAPGAVVEPGAGVEGAVVGGDEKVPAPRTIDDVLGIPDHLETRSGGSTRRGSAGDAAGVPSAAWAVRRSAATSPRRPSAPGSGSRS